MRRDELVQLLQEVEAGTTTTDDALKRLSWLPIEAVGSGMQYARLDHHRALRQGFPEVVLAAGKTAEQLIEISRRIAARGSGMLATRVDADGAAALRSVFPKAEFHDLARTVHVAPQRELKPPVAGPLLIVCAGTADLPVAEEARVTAGALGNPVETLYDVGVAGIHRILGESDILSRAAVVVVVAGMEGALPSVVGGLVSVPVIAVPTSTGYGAAFGGVAALLGMLNSCAAGLTVVNIDNGFGAAFAATRINRLDLRPNSG